MRAGITCSLPSSLDFFLFLGSGAVGEKSVTGSVTFLSSLQFRHLYNPGILSRRDLHIHTYTDLRGNTIYVSLSLLISVLSNGKSRDRGSM